MTNGLPFTSAAAAATKELRLPTTIDREGILVGWSMEQTHVRQPIGFSFERNADPDDDGIVDPILMNGEGHLITVAPTGAGKGVGCIIPALLRHRGPVIVIDPKGENAAVTARCRQMMGDKVVVLDPMGITGQPSGTLNPLDLIDPQTNTGVDDAVALVATLLPKEFTDDRNQYWWSRARQLLTGIVLHVVSDLPKEAHQLSTVRRIVNDMAGDPRAFAETLQHSRHPEVRLIYGNLAIAAQETLGGIISFAQEGVDFIRGPLINDSIASSSFDFEDVTRGTPLSIYLVLPPHMLESHSRLLRLWIGTLLTAVMRRRSRPPLPTLFILDEAAQLGTLGELRQAITLLRGYGLQTWSFWQDVSQLKLLYPRDWETMINNCRVVQAFGANNMNAADAMSELLGFISGPQMLDLEQEEMLLQIAGDEAVVAKRPNYLTDPAFTGLFDANPLFDPARDPLPERQIIREYLRPEKKVAPPRPQIVQGRFGPSEPNPVDALLANMLLERLWPEKRRTAKKQRKEPGDAGT